MFNNKNKALEKAINEAASKKLEEAIKLFDESEYGTEEYYKNLAQIEKLKATTEKKDRKGFKIDGNVIASIITTAGGIIGTVLILTYEQDGVITSKATSIASKMLGR